MNEPTLSLTLVKGRLKTSTISMVCWFMCGVGHDRQILPIYCQSECCLTCLTSYYYTVLLIFHYSTTDSYIIGLFPFAL